MIHTYSSFNDSVFLDQNQGIKNDFSAQLHKFLANLTDTRWKLEGKTVLYIPTEGLKLKFEEAAKNKDLVQRLESRCHLTSLAAFVMAWEGGVVNIGSTGGTHAHSNLRKTVKLGMLCIKKAVLTYLIFFFSCNDPLGQTDQRSAEQSGCLRNG